MTTPTGLEEHYLNTQSADVYFVCLSDDRSSTERIAAHKIVLASKCPAFQAMFYGTLPEKGDVTLPLVTASAFKVFLQLFYLVQADLTMDTIQGVIDLTKQYQMIHGLAACGVFMMQNVSEENFIVTYELSLLYEMTELKSFCEIAAPKLLTEESICNCNQNELKHILQIKQLYADFDLIDICMKWAKISCQREGIDANQDNLQNILGDCVQFMDFTSMSTEMIRVALVKCGALLEKNALQSIVGILMMRGGPIDVNIITWVASENIRNKRSIKPIETMTLSASKQISLKAVGFSPIYWEDSNNIGQDIYGQLVIMKQMLPDEPEHTILLRESFHIQANVGSTVHIHRLASSLILEPNRVHLLQVQLMLRNNQQIFSRSLIRDGGVSRYNRGSTEVLFAENTIIGSLGLGVEYIDPQIIRPMLA